ncbi:MAG: Type restriction protein res subunit [Paenibacillaceae bacterium]|jgi:superfamily II DNA or RNA helicase|nr:Type restriction protein res subunit [Paenibacillaceae bacterium]
MEEILELLQSQGVTVELVDERVSGIPIQTEFCAELKEEQLKAAEELFRYDTGILSATTAFGKTVIGAWMIAARGASTLVLVHRTQLLEQWKAQLALFLNIPADEIGQLGGGKNKRTGCLDVAMLQSIHGREDMLAAIREYGQIIVDECHHISAFSFEQVLNQARSKYVLGLTATFVRKDGHHPIVSMQCGPVRYRVDAKSQARSRPFRHVVLPRYTSFRLQDAEAMDIQIQELYDRLIMDDCRNDLIFDDLLKALDQGRSPILLTDRTAHLEYFEKRLKSFAKNVIVLRGGMGKKRWKEIQEQIRSVPADQERVFLATGRFTGEGFDDARLDTLFLVTPISWKGTLQQYAGRLHRLYESKREVQIYDYVDKEVPKLMRMYTKRRNGYMSMGYTEETLT